ncbi:acyl-coenzyme A thioesterase 9 mitochondrial [Prunus yedoensis var. nudiflora]|uniref:Acyl-coenzyme A thioesterase 9 mitochondrial n=1 Tax=Prunus yedoensis var. nudiflora TaxID=2094558 RepID=A0A314UZG8_PRUYE|nr:acyl-coenzyme A thioesterase 9 mitochondrial [Prunus yedoensis var. nudiflora]
MSVSIDMKIVSNVIWVGRSSIEIQLEVTQPSQEDLEDASDSVALTATFICVAVDSKTGEAVPVNHLLPETKQEKALFKETEARNSLRKSKRGKELENGEVLITKNRVEAMLAEGWIFNNMPSLAEGILMRETCLGYASHSTRTCMVESLEGF